MADDFDPRFNPAFQRGYEGPVPEAQPADRIGRPPARTADPVPVAMPRQSPPEQEAYDRVEDRFIESEVEGPRRPNPFLIALGLIAAVLVGGGLFLVSRLRDLFADTQSSSNFDFVTLQVLTATAPLLITLGLATGIGVLFIYAIEKQRRR